MTPDRLRVDDALDRLRQELAIAPSPNFESRVRARMSVRRADRASVRHVRRAAGSVVRRVSTRTLAAVLVIATVSFARAFSLMPEALDSAPTLSSPRSATGWSPPSVDRGIDPGSPIESRPRFSDAGIVTEWSPGSSDPGTTAFEVLVPPDQARALAQLLAAARGGDVTLLERRVAVDPETGELLPPPPIEIAMLPVIPPLDPIDDGAWRDRR